MIICWVRACVTLTSPSVNHYLIVVEVFVCPWDPRGHIVGAFFVPW